MKRIKKYFAKKPKGEFWMWAFIYLFIFQYFTPWMIILSIMPFGLGLAAPQTSFNETYQTVAPKLTDTFLSIMETMTGAGQNIAINNPFLAKILFFGISHMVWGVYMALIVIIGHILRMLIYSIFFSKKERKNNEIKEQENE